MLRSFRTTDDNCVDTAEADEERSEEAKSWRDWTGIGTLYCGLARLNHVQVKVQYFYNELDWHSDPVLWVGQAESYLGKGSVFLQRIGLA